MLAQAPCIDAFIPESTPGPGDTAPGERHAAPAAVAASASAAAPASVAASASASASASVAAPAFPAPASRPAAEAPPDCWAASLLAADRPFNWRNELSRFGVGIGLAALYGIALGTRQGGASFFRHALGVPAAMIAVGALGVPALTIVLTLFNAPLDPSRSFAATSRAAASMGLVLGGLAPAAALFVITSDSRPAAAVLGLAGLVLAGSIGLKRLIDDLRASMAGEDPLVKTACAAAFLGFAVFALALAARVWWGTLPLLNGGAS